MSELSLSDVILLVVFTLIFILLMILSITQPSATRVISNYAGFGAIIGSTLVVLMSLIEHIYKSKHNYDELIVTTLLIYFAGTIFSLPSTLITGLAYIFISPYLSRALTVLVISLIGGVISGLTVVMLLDQKLEQFLVFGGVGFLSAAIITIGLVYFKKCSNK